MSDVQDLLLEIGTEELPPKALLTLPDALAQELTQQLQQAKLTFGQVQTFATPRRLAIKIDQLAVCQPLRRVNR
nr:glycine--tRNA ligase subunit beta [Legionellales bacterium]